MLKGSIVALVTPFHEDGSVNFEKLGELLEYHIAKKSGGIVILGTQARLQHYHLMKKLKLLNIQLR